MQRVTGKLIRAQAAELRGVDLDARRADEIAADISRINAAANAARALLEFEDEPARFQALLAAAPAAPRKRR